MTCLYAFSRAWRQLHVFATSSDWFIGLSVSVVIGQSDYFGFGFTIRHFHIVHNALCLPQNILHKHCFQFLLGREIENNAYAKFLGVHKVHYGQR